jgi:NADPH-dependent glutamate synthase beta subunit-like oxidoreductase/formate hydrogenlyase subunit 6/NADH:ubiquinone oxidoreductase subunit I
MKSQKNRLHTVMVIGATPAGVSAANKLGELDIPVTLVDADADLNDKLGSEMYRLETGVPLNYAHRPGLIRLLRNSNIRRIMPAEILSIRHSLQGFRVQIEKKQTYVDPARCTLCGRCEEICPLCGEDGKKPLQINSRLSLPGRAIIDKRSQPLCQANCPLGVNAQGYIALAQAGKYQEALALIRRDNVLPGICGRVCTHPCEDACRRGDLDAPLAIRDIKRFVADHIKVDAMNHKAAATPKHSERIAVIGAGPAGIAAAVDLARQGFGVTIFEKENAGGGLLRYGIGPHRLPRSILDQELEAVKAEGVHIVTGRSVLIPQDLPELRKTFNAVVLATGSWADRRLGVPGEDLDGVEGCLSFLTQFYRNQISSLREKVAVIGDGNAAFDLARVLQRLGASVTIVSWFHKDHIPADPREVSDAIDEGIIIKDGCQVTAFIGENGRLQNLRMQPTQPGPCDENGIAWPVITPGSDALTLDFDRAFVAIGQAGAYGPVQAAEGLDITDRGLIRVDDHGCTGIGGVYAAGDSVTGATSVVLAMAHGRRISARIIQDLNDGAKPQQRLQPLRPENRDFDPVPSGQTSEPRASMPELPPSHRQGNFKEVALGYDEAQARSEAFRCLQCGGCSQCLECLKVCEANEAIRHDEQTEMITENTGILIVADPELAQDVKGEDVIRAYGPPTAKPDVHAMIQRGFAAAAKAMAMLMETSPRLRDHGVAFITPDPGLANPIRIGVFACRCNDSMGWTHEMTDYLESLIARPEVVHTEALCSACIPEGISHIQNSVREKALTRVVMASCVCCPLNYVCSACTDQRSRLKGGLFSGNGISRSMVQTCNLRGEVLRLMEDVPKLALELFKGLMDRSIRRATKLLSFPAPARTYNFTTAVIGNTEAARNSALTLAHLGIEVFMFGTPKHPLDHRLDHQNIHAYPGSEVTAVSGTLGNFQVNVSTDNTTMSFIVGCVILGEKSRRISLYRQPRILNSKAVQSFMQKDQALDRPFIYPGATSISGLFLADPPGIQISKRTKGAAAAILVAAAMPRGSRQYRGFLVTVKENLCRSCGRCLNACPYEAISLKPNPHEGFVAEVDSALCKGCGNCISVCPSNAADSPFRDQAYLEETLEEVLVGYRRES